jgi:predicted nuclease of predicted toxin-antitoxin system
VKLLFDQNLSYRLCALIADVFPGSEQVRRAALDQAADADAWSFAAREDFIVVSMPILPKLRLRAALRQR